MSSRSLVLYPIATYAVLACLFGWMFTIADALGAGIEGGQFPLGPIMAAALVSLGLGRPGLRRWGGDLARLRTAPGWYLLATLGPIAMMALLVLANGALGAPLPSAEQLAGWRDLGPTFVAILIAIGIGEEAGWTAFAAPRLLERYPFVKAWLVLAAIRTIWHLPLMLDGDLSLVVGIGGNFAFQFVVLWLFRRTGVWFLAAIWHTVHNVVSGSFLFQMVDGPDQTRLGILLVIGYGLLALGLAAVDRRPAIGADVGRGPAPSPR
ncbi:MAG: CPBP family intramembrane glutamic endopeptidase [Gemmatimonadales bacterium]